MHKIRRSDRAIGTDEAHRILVSGEYGILSIAGSDQQPYGVPLSFCVVDNCIYFHCATEGRKTDIITENAKASFCVVGKTHVLASKFSTKYESAIAFGQLWEAVEGEKQKALEGLILKYSPEFIEKGREYIQAQDRRTRVFGLTIELITGKSRR